MPFFIPIMIAATVASMIPSFLPSSATNKAQRVITQDGRNYFNRQTWRTGNPSGSISHSTGRRTRRPYSKVDLDPSNAKNGINIPVIALLIGAGLGIIILIKVIKG
jgi:hypothetical protein|tara:strand:+ start:544 stop:861 length:318 start_codon:yes stop_codon:yes gene_type:complete